MNNVSLETAIGYVAAAYMGIWMIFFIYLAVAASRLSNLRKQVEALSEAVNDKTKKTDK